MKRRTGALRPIVDMAAPAYLIVGRVRRAHGIRGEVVVEALTDDAMASFAVGRRLLAGTAQGELVSDDAPLPHELTIRRATPFKNAWILRFQEIADRTVAEQWRDRYLLLAAAEAPAPASGDVFFHDLIGMRVERTDGRDVGRVTRLYEVPQGVLLEIETPHGSTLLPYGPPMVVRADVERATLIVDPPAGLLDEE